MSVHLRQEHIAFQANLYESKNPTRRWLHQARRNWVQNALHDLARSRSRRPCFLEVGIGCGIYTHFLAKQGKVFAIDINPAFVDAANRIPNVQAEVADVTSTRFEAKHDIALCSEVIEHLPPSLSQAALCNIFASLKPGGYLVLTTPNSYSTVELTARLLAFKPVVKLARRVYGESVDDLGHTNRLTCRKLRKQIASAGFEIVRQHNLAFYLPGIAEFGGEAGVRFCRWAGRRIARSPLRSLLWTQCWVLRRPAT